MSAPRRSQSFHGMICDEDGKARPCHHNHRTHQAAQECSLREERRRTEAVRAAEVQLISGMSGEEYLRTEEYLRAAKADPVCREELRRLDAQSEAELRRFICAQRSISVPACENDQFEVVPGRFGAVGIGRGAQAAAPCTRPGRGLEMRTGPEASEQHHRAILPASAPLSPAQLSCPRGERTHKPMRTNR
jgi:hypothetical protein